MKKQALFTIFFLLIVMGRAAGQCTPTSGPATQAICVDSPVATTVFTFPDASSASISPSLPAGVSTSFDDATDQFTISGTPVVSSSTVSYTITYTSGSCADAFTLTVNALPDVTFPGILAAQCLNSTAYALSGGAPAGGTYTGPGVSGTNFNASLAGVGPHTIVYSYTDGTGCTKTATNTIDVIALPDVTFTGTLTAQCISSTTYAISGGSPVGGTYSGPGVSGTNFNASSAGIGSHTIVYSYTDGTGCTKEATNNIDVVALPTVDAGDPITAICQGGTTGPLGGSVGGGATGSWSSNDPSGTIDTKSTLDPADDTFTASTTSPASVTLTLTANNGTCISSTTKTLTVNANPTINAGGALASICQGGTTSPLGATVNAEATGVWTSSVGGGTFDGRGTSDPSDDTYTASSGSTSPITLTLTATQGTCSVSLTKALTVNQNPTANAGGAISAICQGGTTLGLGGSIGGSATGGTWTSSVGAFSSPTNLNATWTPPSDFHGNATLTLTTMGGDCIAATASKEVTVNPLPTLATALQPIDACSNSTSVIQLTGVLANTGMTIYYSINNSSQTPAIVTSNGSGVAEFETRVLTNSGDNGEDLDINSIDVNSTGCSKAFTTTFNLVVDKVPTLTKVQQDVAVCAGSAALINLSGLLANTTSTIYYSIDNGPGQTATNVTSAASGAASFTSGSLLSAYNSKRLYVTAVRNTGWESNCYNTIADEYAVLEVKTLDPVVLGTTPVCANVPGQVFSTNIAAATSYLWEVTGGGTINGSSTNATVSTTWSSPGTIKVTCTKDGCTNTSPALSVNVNPSPSETISGPASVCLNSPGKVYSISGGMTSYLWSVSAGGTITSSTDGSSISVTWGTTGPQTVSLNYTNPVGCNATAVYNVTVRPLPSPGLTPAVAAVPRIHDAVTYSTEGSAGFSAWSWQVSAGGSGTSTTNTINVVWNSTGAQTVKVNYLDAYNCTAASPTNLDVIVKPLPSVTGLTISYTYPSVGTAMEAVYDYHDGISSTTVCTGCTYQWYRNNVSIDGATAKSYTPVTADADKTLTVRVTPVSSEGVLPPYTGVAVTSSPTEIIEDLSAGVPVASQVCIEGIRQVGSILKGKYIYTYPRAEGASHFKWFRTDNSGITPVITEIGTLKEYSLKSEDLEEDIEISFSVKPVSSNKSPVEGIWTNSADLARIINLKTDYSITDPDVPLVQNVGAGSFSGSGVSGNITSGYVFSPSIAGAGLHPVNYILFYDYTAEHSCSQRAPYEVNVDPAIPVFSAVNSRYCSDGGEFTVTVTNIKVESLNNDFQLKGPSGVYTDDKTVQFFDYLNNTASRTDYITINPAGLVPGDHLLTYSYRIKKEVTISLPPFYLPRVLVYYLTYSKEVNFYIDKVSTEMKLLGLDDAYCVNAGQKYLSVEGVYPLGGTGTWTGTLIKPVPDNLSAYIDPARGTPGTKYTLTYQYMSPLLCPGQIITREVAVKPLPDPSFAIDPTFNVTGEPEKMLPVTGGGVFSGKGVSGDLFIPSVADVGSHTITYVATANSCVDSAKTTVQVRAALGSFRGITDTVCYRKASLNISMVNLPLNGIDGVISYNGFSNSRKTLANIPGSKTAVYSIVAAGEGPDTLTYSYVWDGVSYDIKKIINIDSTGTAIIYNLHQDQMICDDVAPFELTLSKPGGVFDPHSPVFGGYFDPSKATMSDTVKYTFTSKAGCSVDTSIYVNVYKAPKVDFIPYDICIEDDTDTLMFMNKTTSVSPVVKWQWEFFDEGKMATDSLEESGYLYLKGGLQQVALTAQTDKGCVVRKEKTFNIGRRPEADFYWMKDCYYPNESLLLLDATKFSTPPKSYSWKTGNREFGTSNNASLLKTDTGFVRIEYIVRTDYYNCHDTVVKNVYIRPTIVIPPDGYFQDFESGKGGWIKGDNSAIWSFGLPSGQEIKSASSGQHAWYTASARDGSSSVESPCFDLSASSRPSLKLMIRKDFDKERDGVVMQYRLGDDPEWRNIGRTLEDGISWYNSTAINGKPGGSQLGWTTAGSSDEKYLTAIHTLDELKGNKDVRFRFAYGSSGSYSERDGFAFDDIFIGERSRQVLVEHFTSYNDVVSNRYKPLVDTIANHLEGDVINIQYHSDMAGIDSLFVHNPGEINARTLYYGLTKVPYTFVDGGNGENHASTFDYRLSVIDSNVIIKRTLVNSPFRLYIDPVVSGRVLNIKGYIKAVENMQADNLTLFLAVTEKKNSGDFEGVPSSETFINVFRKFIPDAGGILLKTRWSAGDSITLPERSWIIDKVLNSADIEIIAFVQNTTTTEVHQAFSVIKPDIVTAAEDPLLREGRFSLYPNPASDRITIGFPDVLRNEVDIKIYNIGGEIIREYRAGAGISEFTIEDPGLKGGIYLVRVSRGIFDLGFRKLIITED